MILRGGTPRWEPAGNPAPPAGTEGSDLEYMKHIWKHRKVEIRGSGLPYSGVHVAPHVISQTVNTGGRKHPLNNPEQPKKHRQNRHESDRQTTNSRFNFRLESPFEKPWDYFKSVCQKHLMLLVVHYQQDGDVNMLWGEIQYSAQIRGLKTKKAAELWEVIS